MSSHSRKKPSFSVTKEMDAAGVSQEIREEILLVAALNSAVRKYREIHRHPESPTEELEKFIAGMAVYVVGQLKNIRSEGKQ